MSNQLDVSDVSESVIPSASLGSLPTVPAARKWWQPTSLSDVFAPIAIAMAAVSLFGLGNQLAISTATNRLAMRSELYQTENGFFADEGADTSAALSSLWARVPPQTVRQEYAAGLLRLITDDSTALAAPNAEALYHAAFDISALTDSSRSDATSELRRTFLHVQSIVYHVQNAFDFRKDNVLTDAEWLTWKGIIGEMNSHPILVMVIWNGYQNRYLSQEFGNFLREELCGRSPYGPEYQARNCAFAKYYYPRMFERDWSLALPSY